MSRGGHAVRRAVDRHELVDGAHDDEQYESKADRKRQKKARKQEAKRYDKIAKLNDDAARLRAKNRSLKRKEVSALCKRAARLGVPVDLSGANLQRAKLQGMDLSAVVLTGADLLYARLNGADLRGARLSGADFRGADLSGARLNSPRDLERCRLSEQTIMPGGQPYRARPPVPTIPLPRPPVPTIPLPQPPVQQSQSRPPVPTIPLPQPPVQQSQSGSSNLTIGFDLVSAVEAAGATGMSAQQIDDFVAQASGGNARSADVVDQVVGMKLVYRHPGAKGRLIGRTCVYQRMVELEQDHLDRNPPLPRAKVEASLGNVLQQFGFPIPAKEIIDHGLQTQAFVTSGGKLTSAKLTHRLHEQAGAVQGPSGRLASTSGDDEWMTIGMHAHHTGEDQQGVDYFDANQRKDYLLTVVNGQFVDATGQAARGPDLSKKQDADVWYSNQAAATSMRKQLLKERGFTPDQIEAVNRSALNDPQLKARAQQATLDVVAKLRNNPCLIFVMSQDGRFYAGEGEGGKLHHSSFLAGAGIAAGGELALSNGVPTYISNESGHYQPGPALLWQAVKQMQLQGVPIDRLRVQLYGCPEISAAAFLENFNPAAPAGSELELSFDPGVAVTQINQRVKAKNLA